MKPRRDINMQRRVGIVVVVVSVLCLAALAQSTQSTQSPGEDGGDVLQQRIRGQLTDGKKKIARSWLSTELQNRDSITVTPSLIGKLGKIEGSAASTFRSFNQSFILAGKVLYRLIEGPGPSGFSTEPVATFQEFLGEVAFVESVEWDGLLYLLAAYKQGLLQLFTVSSDNKVILRQSIDCKGIPTDAEFFMQDEKLFLVVAAQNGSSLVPMVVYRWYGTQLDQEQQHLEVQATAVSTFPFQDSVMIVIAVGPTSNRMAGLDIFRKRGDKFELVGFIPIEGASALQHYKFKSENFVLMTRSHGPSVIFWWSGNEMIIWDVLKHETTVRSVGVNYIRGETLIVLAESTMIRIYRPTVDALQVVDSQEFIATVQSASLYVKHDSSISLLTITVSEGKLTPVIVELQLVFKPASVVHRVLIRHPLLQCISSLEAGIKNRRLKLASVASHKKDVIVKTTPGRLKGKLVVKNLVPKYVTIKSLKLNSSASPVMSGHDLKGKIDKSFVDVKKLSDDVKNVVLKSEPTTFIGRLKANDLRVENVNIDSVTISSLNGQSFEPRELLFNNRDQTLTGAIHAELLSTDHLTVGYLNNLKVDDLLHRNAKFQVISGVEQITHVKANKIVIKSHTPVNGISLKRIVTVKSPSNVITVSGSKTFSHLNLEELAVGLLNNVNFTNWVQSLVPPAPIPEVTVSPVPTSGRKLTFRENLYVQDLTVHGKINGIPFNDLLTSLFLKDLHQQIDGDVKFTNLLGVQNLETSFINGVPTVSLMTLSTNQVISGNLSIASLSTPDLYPGLLNGLNIKRDVAYVDSQFPVSTPVVFDNLKSHDLLLPPLAIIAGEQVNTSLLSQPKIVYEKRVIIKGSLKLTDVDLSQARVLLPGGLVDFKNLKQQYWTTGTDQVIPNGFQASSGLTVKSLRIDQINGFSLDKFVDLSLTKKLQGTWHFSSAVVNGNVNHEESAVQAPVSVKQLSSNIVKTSGSYTVSGVKAFVGGLTTKHLFAEYVDSKKVSDIFGDKPRTEVTRKFNELRIGGDLHVRSDLIVGSVNGPDVCKRMAKAVLIDRRGHIPGATFSAISASNINVKTFNSVPFDVIIGRQNISMPRVRKITIKGNVHVPSLQNVMSINNKPLTQDYLSRVVDRTKSGVIRGKKTFASQLNVEGSFDSLDYNNIKIKDLFDNVLSKTRDQTLTSKVWMKEMIADELIATTVNDIKVGNFLTLDSLSPQTVEGDLVFTSDLNILAYLSASDFEDGCDLATVLEKLQRLDGRHWASLVVEGNLDWDRKLPFPVPGLSYYLESAVTKNGQQPLSAEISFKNSVSVQNFFSKKDINDIDFKGILSDSLRISVSEQVVHGRKIFVSQLKSSSMHVTENIAAKNVADLDVADFNRSLVRVDGDQNVRGAKRFLQGFKADLLKVDGTVNGLLTSDVANYDIARLPPINFFGPLEINGDLTFERVNDLSLENLLENRVTLDGFQKIHGHNTFTRDLSVLGNMVAPSINHLDISDIVQQDSFHEQVIPGVKHFTRDVKVEGVMVVDRLEGVELQVAHNAALFRDENATIFGNLDFGNIVNMDANLDVATTVNGAEMALLANKLRSVQARSWTQVHSIARTINDTNLLLEARGDLSEMLYLEPVPDVPVSLMKTHRAVAMDIGGGETYIDLYGLGSNMLCGLPTDCACPTQYSVYVGTDGLQHVTWKSGVHHNTSERSFTFHLDKPHVSVVIKTNTVSSSSRCRRNGVNRLDEVTMLTWAVMNEKNNHNDVLGETTLNIEPTPILGYVSDVKVMNVNGLIYVVLGISYNADLDSSNINSVVVRLDISTQRATRVDEFPTFGVAALDVFSVNGIPHLVVGNSFDSSRDSSQVHLDIYRFDLKSELLILVKSIPAEGVVSVSSFVQGGDRLIVVAQNQLYAPVMVLKYDPLHKDYHFMQQLNPNTIPTGLGVFYIGQPGQSDAFLGVSTIDSQFYLYKFCHAEGFKLVMKMELPGVQGFTSFSLDHRQYLLFSSSETPTVFEIVKQS